MRHTFYLNSFIFDDFYYKPLTFIFPERAIPFHGTARARLPFAARPSFSVPAGLQSFSFRSAALLSGPTCVNKSYGHPSPSVLGLLDFFRTTRREKKVRSALNFCVMKYGTCPRKDLKSYQIGQQQSQTSKDVFLLMHLPWAENNTLQEEQFWGIHFIFNSKFDEDRQLPWLSIYVVTAIVKSESLNVVGSMTTPIGHILSQIFRGTNYSTATMIGLPAIYPAVMAVQLWQCVIPAKALHKGLTIYHSFVLHWRRGCRPAIYFCYSRISLKTFLGVFGPKVLFPRKWNGASDFVCIAFNEQIQYFFTITCSANMCFPSLVDMSQGNYAGM